MSGISERKSDHLAITASGEGAYPTKTTLLEHVHLVHQSLPELALDDVLLETNLFGKTLRAPILIGAMTGGTEEAQAINLALASVAQEMGLGFCLGSQRIMLEEPSTQPSFMVRDKAPNTLLLGNLGVVQAAEYSSDRIEHMLKDVGADGLVVHLNPAQEVVQANGDRDFTQGKETLKRLRRDLRYPIIAKETGCGISRQTAKQLLDCDISHVEVSGAGGTSWTRVEAKRDASREWVTRHIGEWGIPTAASLLMLKGTGLTKIASGGVRTGIDVARCIALGADACAVAQPVLKAFHEGGIIAVRGYLKRLTESLRMICLLTGCANLKQLSHSPMVLGDPLSRWLHAT